MSDNDNDNDNNNLPRLGDPVYYYDDSKHPHAAIVAFIHPPAALNKAGRPSCNLAIFKHDGRVANRLNVEAAYHNGTLWILINKWSFQDEVPEDEWSHLPPPYRKKSAPGTTRHIYTK